MIQFKRFKINASLGWTYLLFWYLSGMTQLLIALTGGSSFEGFKDATIVALLWMIPVLLLSRDAKKVSGILAVFVWITALPGFGYFLIYGQELTQSLMMIVFESNKAESSEYLQNYFSIKILLSFLLFTAVPIFLWSKIKAFETVNQNGLRASALIVFLVFFSPVKNAIKDHNLLSAYKKANYHMGVAPPWQLVFGYANYQKNLQAVENNLLSFNKIPPLTHLTEEKKPLPTTVVIVIGESTSRLHMSLYGYPRDTNPKLSSIKNELAVFKEVYAPRPYTIESLEQVLTFADQLHPDDYLVKPSVMAMLRQAGYKTYWITNQQTLTERNTMLTTFAKQTDEQIFLNTSRRQNAYSFDEKVIQPFVTELAKPNEKKLIVVHLLGTHMKYSYRYPDNYEYFKGSEGLLTGLSADKVDTINEYDNAVRYNDDVMYQLINALKKQNQSSLLVYFSDHGEDVYDSSPHVFDGRNEAQPTLPMYSVPFIVWHSALWPKADLLSDPAILNRQYDNADFIYTLSDLLGIHYDGFLNYESLVNRHFKEDTILVGDPYRKSALRMLAGTNKPAEADLHFAKVTPVNFVN